MIETTLNKIIGNKGLFIDGDWVESKDQDPNGDIRLIQLADIGDGYFVDKSRRFLTFKKAKELKCTFLQKGDILIARMPDPIGRACIFPGSDMPCVTVVDICIVRPDFDLINPVWLKFLVNNPEFRNKICRFITGTTRQRISRNNLSKIRFHLPSLPEQNQIATVLSKAESLIAKRKESIRLLDEFLKSTFFEMFGDPVRNEKGWEKTELKNYSKIRIGPFGSLLHKKDYVINGIPLVNPSHISDGKIFIDHELTISRTKLKELTSYMIHEDDVVLARRGEVGRCAVVTRKEDGYLCGTGSMFIRPLEELNPIFLYNLLSSASIRTVLENSAKGITMKNLNSGIIENFIIPVPPIKIQIQFAQIVEKTELIKTQYRQSLEELENFYSSLSQKAYKGEMGKM